ncbi:hypothetical protein EVAR_100641_1 [Eumeta japonica]|uniref:Uncharacterized protein n=1 Tax=Eumeta variegata TaxID=151549 RepID=A0A4C1TIM7_EUMVA|nr:hypothetical protein EVAR_100641_1 [Eumeta japonica]
MSFAKFIILADSLVDFSSDLNEHRIPVTSVHAISIQREEVKGMWSQIKVAYEKLLFEKKKEATDDEEENTSIDLETLRNKYKNSYVTYSNILTKLAELDEELQLKERLKPETSLYSQKLESTHHDHVDSHNFSLPPCDIEIFRGDYATWPTFRDLFTAVFIKNSRLSPVEKLFHLTQKTKDLPEIPLADPYFHRSAVIDILIGGDVIPLLCAAEGYPDKLCLGESRKSALAQFYRNEARLLRNPELKPVYDNVVQEYKDLNHMSEVSDANAFHFTTTTLPHHAVIKPESTTTKVSTAASLILKENMYVDDVLVGEHTISAAIDAKNELVEALETAGFSLCANGLQIPKTS